MNSVFSVFSDEQHRRLEFIFCSENLICSMNHKQFPTLTLYCRHLILAKLYTKSCSFPHFCKILRFWTFLVSLLILRSRLALMNFKKSSILIYRLCNMTGLSDEQRADFKLMKALMGASASAPPERIKAHQR